MTSRHTTSLPAQAVAAVLLIAPTLAGCEILLGVGSLKDRGQGENGPGSDASWDDGGSAATMDAGSADARGLDATTDGNDDSAAPGPVDSGAGPADGGDAGPLCAPNAASCQSNGVVTCSDAGTWLPIMPCPTSDPYCNGAGVCGTCASGATQCADSKHVETCTTGGTWGSPASCNGQACVSGSCGGVCAPGAVQCGDGGVETCTSGGQWGQPTACSQGICQSGACVGSCAAGSVQCSGNGVQNCTNGQWGGVMDCTGQTCSMGACTGVCAPGATQCSTTGNAVQTCSGGQWSTSTTCTAQTCVGGSCTGVCAPGMTQCSGNATQSCIAGGQWGNTTACTGTTPLCANGACAGCTGGTTACNGACVNEQNDPSNCGACGRSCIGGTCAAGICQPWVVASATAPTYVATDGTNVFWADQTAATVSQIAATGGATTVLVSGLKANENGLSVANGSVIYASSQVLTSIPVIMGIATVGRAASGMSVNGPSSSVTRVALSPDATHYFVNGGEGTGVGLAYTADCAVGASCTKLSVSAPPSGGVAADATGFFYAVSTGIAQTAYGSATATVVYSPSGSSTITDAFADDGSYVYWAESASGSYTIRRMPVANPSTSTATTVLSNGYPFAANGTYVYFNEQPSGGLGYAPVNGGSTTTISATVTPSQMALSGHLLVFLQASSTSIYAVIVP